MNFSLLLIHDEGVPMAARQALRAANDAVPSDRSEHLQIAARALAEETDLGCAEIYDLICKPCN